MYGCPVGCSMRARASRRRALLDRRRGRGRGRAVISCFSVALDSRTCKSASSIDIARSRVIGDSAFICRHFLDDDG